MHRCEKCGKNFNKKSNYIVHLNKKFPCVKPQLPEGVKLYICELCEYSTDIKCNFLKHKNRKNPCIQIEEKIINSKDYDINDPKKAIEEICKQYKITHAQVIDMLNSGNNIHIEKIENNTTNNINNTTNNITNNINITINPFGKEDLSHIDNKKARRILNNGLLAVSKYIEYVHQDKDAPQNHNVYIGSWSGRANINMYNGKKWAMVNKEDVIPTLIDNCMDFINDKMDELDKKNPEDEKIYRMANRLKTAYDENDMTKLKCISKEIQKTLYNNKDIIKDTIKKHKL